MINQIISTFTDFFASTRLDRLDLLLSVFLSVAGILTILWNGVKLLFRCLRRISRQKPIDRLYKALISHSIASKSEVIYQILSYIPPRFANKKRFGNW